MLSLVSWAGLRGNVGQTAYSASKRALYAMTLSVAEELGVRVNALSRMLETDMAAAMSESS